MLKIGSREFDRAQYCSVSKKIANSSAKIINDERFIEVISGEFKTLLNMRRSFSAKS